MTKPAGGFVPHHREKMLALYSLGKETGKPGDRTALVNSLMAIDEPGFGKSSVQAFLPKDTELGAAKGTEAQHRAVVELYLGKGSWPFPEYLDLEGLKRDEGLEQFHVELRKRRRRWSFRPIPFEASNWAMQFDEQYLSANLVHAAGTNEVGIQMTLQSIEIYNNEEFPGEPIGSIRARILVSDLTANDGGLLIPPSSLDENAKRSKDGTIRISLLAFDEGQRCQITLSNGEPDDTVIQTPRTRFRPPEVGDTLRVSIRSKFPDVKVNGDLVDEDVSERDLKKLLVAHLKNKVERSAPNPKKRLPIDEGFDCFLREYRPEELGHRPTSAANGEDA